MAKALDLGPGWYIEGESPTKLQEIERHLLSCTRRRKAAIMKVAQLMRDEG